MQIYNHISLNSSYKEKCFRKKVVEKIKTHILCSVTVFWKSCPLWENLKKKKQYIPKEHRWQYSAFALHIGHERLQTHTQNMKQLLLFHCNNGCNNARHYYVCTKFACLVRKQSYCMHRGPGSWVGIVTELRTGRSGDRITVGRDFPPVQTGPGAHPASCTTGTESFQG
jgi:hypothetical protein